MDIQEATFCVNWALVWLEYRLLLKLSIFVYRNIAFMMWFMLFAPVAGFTRRYLSMKPCGGVMAVPENMLSPSGSG